MNAKTKLRPLLQALTSAAPEEAVCAAYHSDAKWRGSHPLNEISGAASIAAKVWRPIMHALPDAERRDMIFIGGEYRGGDFVCALGMIAGTFRQNWLGIPASGGAVYLRYGECHQVRDGKIIQSTVLFDILDLMRQAGFWPVAPSLGAEQMWPPPITGDGLQMGENPPQQGAASLKMVLDMHAIINNYDDIGCTREDLLAMPQKDCWHKKMMWYGPAGIGTCRGLEGYVDFHQLPFRRAFPNRRAAGHYAQIGDGNYAMTGGWPSVAAKHSGGGFLALPPSGRDITMRVMDFYLCDEGLIRENWIPLDMPDVLRQMGADIFARAGFL